MNIRIGHGYDVHKLVADRDLILGGVRIPHETGLLGHSDADVLSHAIADALLGAAGKRDIGYYFPDSDPQYKGMSGSFLLSKVMEFLSEDVSSLISATTSAVISGCACASSVAEEGLSIS